MSKPKVAIETIACLALVVMGVVAFAAFSPDLAVKIVDKMSAEQWGAALVALAGIVGAAQGRAMLKRGAR